MPIFLFCNIFQVVSVQKLIDKVRQLCMYFYKSPNATSILKRKQGLLDIADLDIIIDNASVWGSTHDMIERYHILRPAIFMTLVDPELQENKIEFNDILTMSEADDIDLKDILTLLKPIEQCRTLVCETKHSTISLILPLKEILLRSCAILESDAEWVKDMKQAFIDDLSSRYDNSNKVIIL